MGPARSSAGFAEPPRAALWLAAAFCIAICECTLALGEPPAVPGVQIENRSPTPIQDLYIKKAGSEGWGKNVIDGTIAAGAVRHLTLPEREGCKYDMRVVYQDGRSEEMNEIDLCQGLAVIEKPGEGDTPDKASTSGSSGLNRLLNR
jgi:hypothetical protein